MQRILDEKSAPKEITDVLSKFLEEMKRDSPIDKLLKE